jgi:hypothetical protein
MSFIWDILTTAGVITALIGGATYLTKSIVIHRLSKDLEDYKRGLALEVDDHKARLLFENSRALDQAKFEFEQQLIYQRGEVDIFKDGRRFVAESEKQRNERLRSQVQRWAVPIRSAISDLGRRLEDITENASYRMLDPEHSNVQGWSARYDYFMPSTLYYFAQYFCWTRLLQHQLAHEVFRSTSEMSGFFDLMHSTSDSISRFPFARSSGLDPAHTDHQVFKLQQRAIGELLVVQSGSGENIASYREFVDRWVNADDVVFKRHIAPLETFLRGIAPTGDLRWNRIQELISRLQAFDNACEKVLQPALSSDESDA